MSELRTRAPRVVFDRERAAVQTLEDAVTRVRRNCAVALATRENFTRGEAMMLVGPVNVADLEAACVSAQILLDAEAAA